MFFKSQELMRGMVYTQFTTYFNSATTQSGISLHVCTHDCETYNYWLEYNKHLCGILVQPEVTECSHMRFAATVHYGLYGRCTPEKDNSDILKRLEQQLAGCYTTIDQCGNIILSKIIETSKYIISKIKLQKVYLKIHKLILKNFKPAKFQAIQYQNAIILSFKANSCTSLSC